MDEIVTTSLGAPIFLAGKTDGLTTGLSRYGRSLGKALAELGIETRVVAAKAPPIPKIIGRAAKKAGFDLQSFFSTYPVWLDQVHKPGITHLTSQNQASAVAFSLPEHLVVTVHDIVTLSQRANPEVTGYLKFYDKTFDQIMARGLRKATALIADSQSTKSDLISYLGYSSERIKVVYLGVDHNTFRRKHISADFYARYGLKNNISYLLYVGSEDPRKNLRRLIDAFGAIAKRVPEVHLLKLGAARFEKERQQLLEYVESSGLKERVHFFGQVPDEELACFYNLATVFVFPSLYEGFGWPPLEAMACGTPGSLLKYFFPTRNS
jgi:glycosyltransferase involved in cell wall biosynthesis